MSSVHPPHVDPSRRRARLAAVLGVVAGCTLIWGSLAALNRFVLGFHAWPTSQTPSAQRLVVPDAPKTVVTHRSGERVAFAGGLAAPVASLLPGGTTAAGIVTGSGNGATGGGTTGATNLPASGSPIGAGGGVLGPGGTRAPSGGQHTVAPTPSTSPTTQPVSQTPVPAGTDTDGDGIPDAYEISHGLNPNNPADGAATPNNDGVTNAERYRRQVAANQQTGSDKGTTPATPDTPVADPTTTTDPATPAVPDPAPAPDPTPDPSQPPAVTPDPVVPADPAPTDPATPPTPPAPEPPSGGVVAPDEPTEPVTPPVTEPATTPPADTTAPAPAAAPAATPGQ